MSVVPDALTAAASLAFGVAPLGVQAAQVGEELADELAAGQVAGPDGEMRCSTLAAEEIGRGSGARPCRWISR